jgi:hypothetical protein
MVFLESLSEIMSSVAACFASVLFVKRTLSSLSKGCHLDVVRGPSTPHDPESDAGGSLSSWQGHPSR